MHRIDTVGSESGAFVDYDPTSGKAGTKVDAAIMNALQEEIASFIVAQGISLVKGTNTQLASALAAWLQAVQHTFTAEQAIQAAALRMKNDAKLYFYDVGESAGDSNPPSSDVARNELRAKNVCKAWGRLAYAAGGAVSLRDGFNIASVSLVGSSYFAVLFPEGALGYSGRMDDGNFSIGMSFDTNVSGTGVVWIPVFTNRSTNGFEIHFIDATTGNTISNITGRSMDISFQVFGKQTT